MRLAERRPRPSDSPDVRLGRKPVCAAAAQNLRSSRGRCRPRRWKPDPRPVDDDDGHARYRGHCRSDRAPRQRGLRDRAGDGALEARSREPGRDSGRAAPARYSNSPGGRHPLHAECGDDRCGARGEGPHQPRELCGQEEVRRARVRRRGVRCGTRACGGAFPSARAPLQGSGPGHSHRNEPRLPLGPDHEPLRGHARGNGRERPRVRADL